MPAPLSLRIKERYVDKRADALSQQVAADVVGISVHTAQRIDRGELQPQGQQQQRMRHWRTRSDPLAGVRGSVWCPCPRRPRSWNPSPCCCIWSVPSQIRSDYAVSAPCSAVSSNGGPCMAPGQEVMFLQEHRAGVLGIYDFTLLKSEPITVAGEVLEPGSIRSLSQ